ncbi:hypothetical protein BD410DRAFT_863415 [Rickenella mellea]|uniref:ARM repeat-containing protein n=1 Tax=Rickenella mellea TaxID=50990 RepID=A0A4Y7QNG5_9AGAM|nr:hypothetical protein BD410DRAFT_863415 [Rickenella mellea]
MDFDDFFQSKQGNSNFSSLDMDDDLSMPDSPVLESGELSPDAAEQFAMDKQRAALQTYLDSVPYGCESIDEMHDKLQNIISKIYICAKSRDWLTLSSWDGLLQCWLLMRYPIPKSTRAKLATFYYELCLVPGVEPRIIRSWVDMFFRLVKAGTKRKLESQDLALPWQPLWRSLQKELWPKKRLHDPKRNVVNILLYLAEESKRYFPTDDIPEMLSTFLPLLTQNTILTIIPVMTSFLPPRQVHLYLPAIFKIWEAFNSNVIDDRLIEFVANLAEEHVAGQAGNAGGAQWRDIGIWSSQEWTYLVGKCLGSMNVPVASSKNGNSTAAHADLINGKSSMRVKKTVNKYQSFAKLIVYSLSMDGPVRNDTVNVNKERGCAPPELQEGYLAGSQALDSLDRLITSTESFFHPSNSGPWSLNLALFLHHLMKEFATRWTEEEESTCKTPVTQRLTPAIRRAFISTLRTPALLAMFAKDPVSMTYAQSALHIMAQLEPKLVMPQLLERAYSGLEIVNETHRTTAVLSTLAGVSLPLVSEKLWLGGQKNIIPLLELCVPGIDLNDPVKTVCTTLFICAAVQHMKIGDLSIHSQSVGVTGADDAPMDVVEEDTRIPAGVELGAGDEPVLDKAEERALVRDSTAAFADWVVSLFRRVFALFENLPEEGGKKNLTGGKQEESMLKSIKSTLDVVCLHLSDQLFDLVLKVVYDYATTNVKSNGVRAFGRLVSCLARVKPRQTLDKFLPFCVDQIKEELKHGASSIRTTSTHEAVPSDTTLHWNLSILRGCMGYVGPDLLRHKETILDLLNLLIEKTKSERGYNSSGRLISRILNTLSGVYPLNSRFVNSDEWDSTSFDRHHNLHWGRMYDPKDVKIEWHVPSDDEIAFAIEILERVISPTIDRIDVLLESTTKWDSVNRNDFCRYMQAVRLAWNGLPTLFQENLKEVANPCIYDWESAELFASHLDVKAGFALTDPGDPRYQTVIAHRARFGQVVHKASVALRQNTGGEDHIDAVIGVSRAISVFLLDYAMSRSTYAATQKNYTVARDMIRISPRQKENSRFVFMKRAQMYHGGRVYMHALYRRRSTLDDLLIDDLVEMSLSPYTRVRLHGQAVLHDLCGYYTRSTRFILPKVLDALAKGSDPDRMKGALYILWNKGVATYALSDIEYHSKYIISLLECQHQEKPSIQKLVLSVHNDSLVNFSEEAAQTDSQVYPNARINRAADDLLSEFSTPLVQSEDLANAEHKTIERVARKNEKYDITVKEIVEIAGRPGTHWRYLEMATRVLTCLLRRDAPPSAELAGFFIANAIHSNPTIRNNTQKAIVKMLAFIKIRTYSTSTDELWFGEWKNPLQILFQINEPKEFMNMLDSPIESREPNSRVYIDKITTGFLVWGKSVKAYALPGSGPPFDWDKSSDGALTAFGDGLANGSFFSTLAALWSQESSRAGSTAELTLRLENVIFIKTIAKMFGDRQLEEILSVIDTLWSDSDRFKQRAAAEFIAGLLRGTKHWTASTSTKVWTWFTERLGSIFSQIKPDTVGFWETLFSEQVNDRDPWRNKPIIDWLLALPLEFHSDSAFTMSKSLGLFGILVDTLGVRFAPLSDKYMNMFFDNVHTGYAEIRSHIAQDLTTIMDCQWQPSYPSVTAFVSACTTETDPLQIRRPKYIGRVNDFVKALPTWRKERLPPPRVNQSQYDKVGLSLLQWVWTASHGPQASLVFPYLMPLLPEFLAMSELSDSPELQMYSSAVLYVLSAVTPPQEFVEMAADILIAAIKSSSSWRIKLNGLPVLTVFFYRNLTSFSDVCVSRLMDLVLTCLGDENVEVREMAAKVLSGLLRCSQRHRILPLRNRFVAQLRKTVLPSRQHTTYAESLRILHSAVLGICALVESFPYSVEPWMPPLTEVLAPHASDPAPISTTIRKCASEFKKVGEVVLASKHCWFK